MERQLKSFGISYQLATDSQLVAECKALCGLSDVSSDDITGCVFCLETNEFWFTDDSAPYLNNTWYYPVSYWR